MWHAVEEAVIFDEEVQEVTNEEEEDPEPSSKRRKSDKATKGKQRPKMLTKAEKKRIVDHVKSLNTLAVAALSLTEAISSIPNHKVALLKSSCERILPSQVSFHVKHLQEMFQKLYNECSLMKMAQSLQLLFS